MTFVTVLRMQYVYWIPHEYALYLHMLQVSYFAATVSLKKSDSTALVYMNAEFIVQIPRTFVRLADTCKHHPIYDDLAIGHSATLLQGPIIVVRMPEAVYPAHKHKC